MKGLFITFEGIEGCGKTTQIERFADYLRKEGNDVLLTREPGGTAIGDEIRKILLKPEHTKMSAKAELLLYAAARAQHVAEKIRPATQQGTTVLSDRYADASTAYQGSARRLSLDLLTKLHQIATDNLIPDITFLLDLPANVGLSRARSRNEASGHEDRFENEELTFHEKVREGYLEIARNEPKRVIIINASDGVDDIHSEIVRLFDIWSLENGRG